LSITIKIQRVTQLQESMKKP